MRSALALVFVLVGCGPAAKDPQHPETAAGSGSGSGSGVVCHEVTDTGSMFSHTECTPVEQSQAQRDDADRFLKHPRSEPTVHH